MELDLPMYKEAYRNIAEQIKELQTPDNKEEIKKLEEIIERNQAEIRAWKKGTYDPSVWLSEEMFEEHDKALFEEYAKPYNANIKETQKMITELQEGMDENQTHIKTNKAKQLELKKYADNARKNAETDYKKARTEILKNWETSEEKKKYDSNMETIRIINSRRPNLIKAEEEALKRLNGENIKLQQALGGKLKELEDKYNEFLQDLDEIDKEYGIDLLETAEPEKTTPTEPTKPATAPAEPEKTAPTEPAKPTAPKEPAKPAAPGKTPATPAEPRKPAEKIDITLTSEGIKLAINGKEPKDATQYNTKTASLRTLPQTLREAHKKASEKGDYNVISEIIIAINEKRLTEKEGEEYLKKYAELLNRDPNQKYEHDKNFTVNYDLHGMNKNKNIDGTEKNIIKQAAKKARDLNLGDVSAPKITELWWKITDGIKVVPKALKGFWEGLKTRVNSIGTKEEPEALNPAPEAQKDTNVSEEQVAEEIAKTVAEIKDEKSKESRVKGVETVDVDVSKVVEKNNGFKPAEDLDKSSSEAKKSEGYFKKPGDLENSESEINEAKRDEIQLRAWTAYHQENGVDPKTPGFRKAEASDLTETPKAADNSMENNGFTAAPTEIGEDR